MTQLKTVWQNPAEIIRETRPEHPVMVFAPTVLQDTAKRFLKGFPGLVTYAVKSNPGEEMIENLADFALDLLPHFKERTMPRLSFLNINAEAIPPEQLKGARLCPISDSFFMDRYVQRVNPRGVPYFWIEAGAQTETVKPGTDIDLCEQGYITCTFVGGFTDNNHLFEGMLGTRED